MEVENPKFPAISQKNSVGEIICLPLSVCLPGPGGHAIIALCLLFCISVGSRTEMWLFVVCLSLSLRHRGSPGTIMPLFQAIARPNLPHKLSGATSEERAGQRGGEKEWNKLWKKAKQASRNAAVKHGGHLSLKRLDYGISGFIMLRLHQKILRRCVLFYLPTWQ